MKTAKHPREFTESQAEAIIDEFDAGSSYVVTSGHPLAELRAAAAVRREADSRIEAAALQAHRKGCRGG